MAGHGGLALGDWVTTHFPMSCLFPRFLSHPATPKGEARGLLLVTLLIPSRLTQPLPCSQQALVNRTFDGSKAAGSPSVNSLSAQIQNHTGFVPWSTLSWAPLPAGAGSEDWSPASRMQIRHPF